MKLTELFTQPDPDFGQAMTALLETFHHSDDSQAPYERDSFIHQLDQSSMPATGISTQAYLERLATLVPGASHLTSPRYMGHMTAPLPAFTAELSRLLVMLNQNPMKMESSRLLSFLEREVLAKLHRLVYREDDAFYAAQMHAKDAALGVMTSGGTIANVTALWLARNRACGDNLFSLFEQGYRGAVILGSRLMHYSFDKGMDLLGLGARSVWRLDTDEHNRLSLAALEQALRQCKEQRLKVLALVGVAGSTDFGSIDPLPELAAIARREQIHFHVDAAWGGPTLFSPRYQGLLEGIDQADTVTLDGHKQLLVPLGTGMLLCRQPDLMMAVKREAPYAIRATSFDQGRFTLEGTRPANALYLDAAFQMLGRQGYAELIDANYDRARRMAALIEASPAFELMSAPVMNLLSYRCIPPHLQDKVLDEVANDEINAFNVALQKAQRAEGHSFVSRTQRAVSRYGEQSLTLLRAVLLNPLIEERHIRELLADQQRLGIEVARQLFG
ncbi:aminotransferase class V-fold PLP-dependent enzyme [Aeromonas sp. XH]|uniref:aminotransferase class V-fold PLP-dependent enzyme n=1 Tax=Aeromonas sp. XH TaxID=3081770 RepID=UPI002966FF4C|nr:aminotransferase class V-fold PLP-dependent enzyme [Aeromonas sp. XH]WOX49138.1 aminotransferase class V-fold PLP-dependent enzyme [Aeromonas sp. XH]